MESQYDLYEVKPGSHPQWVGAAVNLEHARRRLRELAQSRTWGKYFVREFRSGAVVAWLDGARYPHIKHSHN